MMQLMLQIQVARCSYTNITKLAESNTSPSQCFSSHDLIDVQCTNPPGSQQDQIWNG